MSCASRAMEVDLEFTEPFYGIVYADFSRSSACSFVGKGGLSYHYELPLTGCGTIQVTLRYTTTSRKNSRTGVLFKKKMSAALR